MRIAALVDIHGNAPAFEAALDQIAKQRVDQIVIVGDIVLGAPDDVACWNLARDLGCPLVRGNADRYLAHYSTPEADPRWTTEQFGPLQWSVRQFSDEQRRQIGALPLTCRLAGVPDLLFCHSSPRSDMDEMRVYTPAAELEAIFADVPERIIVRGHNHNPEVRLWEDRTIITCGSVGAPIDGNPGAQYLLLEQRGNDWHIEHQRVPYDLDATLCRFEESGYLEAAGPIGRLMARSVATSTAQLVPFLRYYKRWSQESDITLAEAVEKFSRLY